MSASATIPILGAGMAGFGAAYHLRQEGVPAVIYDKNPYYGGHTASETFETGFTFDEGPHISFTKNKRIQDLWAEHLEESYETIQARVNNHWKGYWIKHPAQCNLHGLPEDLVVAALKDFIEAQHSDPGPIANYRDWLYASYGRTFADTFPTEYGKKYHTTGPENMTTDWLGPRLYRPDISEVLRGAVTNHTPEVHYISHFRYPAQGGFVSYLKPFARDSELKLDHRLVRLDPSAKVLQFANGLVAGYERVVSSVPLPEMVELIEGVPQEVRDAAGRLACTECVLVNIGVDRADISECHWTYIYDSDFLITRLSFPHMFSTANAPAGAGSIQVEIYYSAKYKPRDLTPEACIEPAIAELRRCGLIRETDTILHTNAALIPYANIIFDLERASAVEIVHGYLDEIGVIPCGRYGEWGYLWTDESFVSGEKAARIALNDQRY